MNNYHEILKTNLGRPPDFSGKVRDVYDLGEQLLLIATDRLSAYDCILPNGIPGRAGSEYIKIGDFTKKKRPPKLRET